MTEQDQQGASCREVEDRVAAAEAETEPVATSDKDGGEGTGEQATVPYSPLFGESEHSDSDDELEWVQENPALLAAMEVDGISQCSQRCSPGTYDSLSLIHISSPRDS